MTSQAEKKRIFIELYNDQTNFMTPKVLYYYGGGSSNFIVELSEGTGLDDKPFYGCTVIEYKDLKWQKRHDLSKGVDNKNRAIQYCKDIVNKGYSLINME